MLLTEIETPTFLPLWQEFLDAMSRSLIRGSRRGPLLLLNYTRKAQYERHWGIPAVRHARGLILNTETGEVAALPFRKFFNYGEPVTDGMVPPLPPYDFEATVKYDGSLGVCYRSPDLDDDRIYWTTRGSFESEQGKAAQMLWDTLYDSPRARELLHGYYNDVTLLVEVLHPITRQVVNYPEPKLVLIGARNRRTGDDLSYLELDILGADIGLPVVEEVEGTWEEIRDHVAGLDHRAEGVVLRFDLDRCGHCRGRDANCVVCEGTWHPFTYRLKLKGSEYLRLHRIIARATPRQVSKAWARGDLDALLPHIPEEFRAQVEVVRDELNAREARETARLWELFADAPADVDQKTFALWVQAHAAKEDQGHLFRMRGGLKPLELRRAIDEVYRKGLPPDPWGEDE